MKFIFTVAVAIALALALPAAASPKVPPEAITVPDLQAEDLHLWVAKSNAYVDLLNGSMRAIESLQRYQSWVDMTTGPTGTEKIIYGLYSVSPEQAKRVIDKARAATEQSPPIPPLDAAARDYAASFETLVPILNDAALYYERQEYKDDKMTGGGALHARILPAMSAFLAARRRLEAGQEALSTALDEQELALIERSEGQSLHWQVQHLAITAKAALGAMPDDKNPDADAVAAFSAAITAYAEAVSGFDAANRSSGQGDQSSPRELLARMRTLREKIEKKDAGRNDFENVVGQYNAVIDLINSYE